MLQRGHINFLSYSKAEKSLFKTKKKKEGKPIIIMRKRAHQMPIAARLALHDKFANPFEAAL